MQFNNKVYVVLKFIAQLVLPSLGTLYFALAGIWGLPDAEQIIGTITAVDAFLGVLLGISQQSFNKQVAGGVMNVVQTDRGKTYSLELNDDPDILSSKKQVRLNVVPHPTLKEVSPSSPRAPSSPSSG